MNGMGGVATTTPLQGRTATLEGGGSCGHPPAEGWHAQPTQTVGWLMRATLPNKGGAPPHCGWLHDARGKA